MKVALIGATGFVGAPVLAELLSRGHAVTVLARNPGKLAPQPGLTVVAADALDAAQVAAAVAGHDAVVSAYNPGWTEPGILRPVPAGHPRHRRRREAGRPEAPAGGGRCRQPVRGPGPATGGHPALPRRVQAGCAGRARGAEPVEGGNDAGLGFLSPPIGLAPGARTGQYRLGLDDLLPGTGEAPAGISVADLAVAIVDEIESQRHMQQRFTVAN
jgi:putative NADH-flavin reductase